MFFASTHSELIVREQERKERMKHIFFYIYFSLVMADMGFHTIDNVHIDLDLILICQCSSEVKKLAQIAPVWSERLGAHPPHVFAALH